MICKEIAGVVMIHSVFQPMPQASLECISK